MKKEPEVLIITKGEPLIRVHRFVRENIKIKHKKVRISDPIIGLWDMHPFLDGSYKITIERV